MVRIQDLERSDEEVGDCITCWKEFGGYRFYYKIQFPSEKIWVDLELLPNSCVLAAMIDGESLLYSKRLKSKKTRIFVGLEWLLNQWGGPKNTIEALKIFKKKALDDMETCRNWPTSNISVLED